MSCSVYDVAPNGESWQVLCGDGSAYWRLFEDKAEAIARAKELALNADQALLVVRGVDGRVQAQHEFRFTKGGH